MRNEDGLIVNVSSPGATRYLHNIPYGVGKAALDRCTADCAHELARHGVTVLSLWPGLTRTEFVTSGRVGRDGQQRVDLPEGSIDLSLAETPRFSGRAVVALAADPERLRRTGRAWPVAELARAYGFTDVDGRVPDIKRVDGVAP
jgi:NAD(P)-dependent dehydrogenase (short-subunit alcohol dehydrogenase family)